MKKVLISPLLLTTCYLLLATEAYADELSLSITPPTIVIETSAPKVIEKKVQIQNNTSETVTLDAVFEPFTQNASKNGKISYSVDKDLYFAADPQIFQKITLLDQNQSINTVTLSPKQTKTLILRIALPENQPNSDYYFSILFISKDIVGTSGNKNQIEKINAYTHLEAAIGIPVLLSIHNGKKQPEGFIDAFTTPVLLQNGPVAFTLKFRNTGNYLLKPQGVILIKNMFGQTVGKVLIPQTNVLAKTTRIIPIAWEETFLFGPYKADLLLYIPDSSISFKRSIFFVGAPLMTAGSIIALIIVILWLRKRVKRYTF